MLFSKPDHIGVIVKDINKAIEYYQSLGIGPFEPLKGVLSIEKRVNGKVIDPNSIRLDARMARVGPVKFEVIQPVVGESLWKDYVTNHGEGINHMGFYVDNVFDEIAKLKKKGFKAIYEAKFEGGGGAAYFDTRKVGGVIIELLEWPPTANVR